MFLFSFHMKHLWLPLSRVRVYIRSEQKYSKTTSKHVNQWLKRYIALNRAVPVPQYQIDALVNVAKVI